MDFTKFNHIITRKLLRNRILFFILILVSNWPLNLAQQIDFNWDWKFHKGDLAGQPWQPGYEDDAWAEVVVPHNPPMSAGEPDPARPTWQSGYSYEGISWYRKKFSLDTSYNDRKIYIRFEAVNTVADVWINSHHITQHIGGYLPFSADITEYAIFGDSVNVLAVKADNTDDPEIPIGNVGWFNWGGIYRDVYLIIKDRLHITDPVDANIPAGGGIFISYPKVDSANAEISIKTHVHNEYPGEIINCTLITNILDREGNTLKVLSNSENIQPDSDYTFQQSVAVENPHLWNPDYPYLYTLKSFLMNETDTADRQTIRFGIRSIKFSKADGFELNGKSIRFRGANRMQDFPYIGYAMPDAAQERDIRLLKEAGFQYLRLSQYPQDPSVLNACDRLGMLAMVPIPGFQHIGGEQFKQISYQNMRDMIRRDRNHPCIIAWELSLNETWWTDPEFSPNAHAIGHEEYPGDQCYVSGWKDDEDYDIFIATPTAGARSYNGPRPLIISEHGHWDYGGANSTSDVDRKDGELKMLRQELNHRSSHSQNRAMENMCGDGLWSGIDLAQYPSGVLDNFRLPKFSYYFWQSQRDPDQSDTEEKSGPMLFIANYWTEHSPTDVKIYSNCDEVELYLNEQLIERRSPDGGLTNSYLLHPPFTFSSVKWEPGELMAIGYIDGLERARYSVSTPGSPSRIELVIDTCGYNLSSGTHNILFVYAYIQDDRGTIVTDANTTVQFSVNGPGEPVSPVEIQSEAGVATFLIRTGFEPGIININAQSKINDTPLSGFGSLEIHPDSSGNRTSVYITNRQDIILGSEAGGKIDVRLWGDYFSQELEVLNWHLEGLPSGVSLDTVRRIDSLHATLILKGNSSGGTSDLHGIGLFVDSKDLVQCDTGIVRSLNELSFKMNKDRKVYVTLQVDMTGISLADGVFINGEITHEWGFERLQYEGNNIYSITYLLSPGSTTSYSFYKGTSWLNDEKETIPSGCASGSYRILNVPSQDTIIGFTWETCLPVGNGPNNISLISDPVSGLIAYPNPVKDKLNLESILPFNFLQIFDIKGRILHSANNLQTDRFSLDMAELKMGTYILIVGYSDGMRKSEIIVKQ